jgi:hypothetical protein
MLPDHIHAPDDGRGVRHVSLDGKRVERVAYADTERGIILVFHNPVQVDKMNKRALTYMLRGKVEVEFIHG